jgi:hypothetical protein
MTVESVTSESSVAAAAARIHAALDADVRVEPLDDDTQVADRNMDARLRTLDGPPTEATERLFAALGLPEA